MRRKRDRNFGIRWLRDLLCGVLIGAGAILPGVSGGVLAVVFDIYRPFMEVLTHPREAIPKYWRWFLPIGLGCAIGFLGFAKGIAAAIDVSSTVTTWLFIGLIVGTVPSLFREAGKEGRSIGSWVSMAVCAGAIFFSLFYVGKVICVTVEPNFWWYNFCGALWGMSLVIPGLTSSSVMMALGLYQPMLEGLARLDFLVLSACLAPAVLRLPAGDGADNPAAGKAGELVLPEALLHRFPRDLRHRAGLHIGYHPHQLCGRVGDCAVGGLLHRRLFAGLLHGPAGPADPGERQGLKHEKSPLCVPAQGGLFHYRSNTPMMAMPATISAIMA